MLSLPPVQEQRHDLIDEAIDGSGSGRRGIAPYRPVVFDIVPASPGLKACKLPHGICVPEVDCGHVERGTSWLEPFADSLFGSHTRSDWRVIECRMWLDAGD